jgi:hypothetical protein
MRLAGDSLRTGTPRVNHAIHKAAITQIRHKYSAGRACYDKKIAEGKTHKEALRSLKRRISDAIYAWLLAEARQTAPAELWKGPGGQPGNHFVSRAADSHPSTGSSEKPLPDLTPPYGPLPRPQQPDRWRPPRLGPRRKSRPALDSKEVSICVATGVRWSHPVARGELAYRVLYAPGSPTRTHVLWR